MEQRYEIRTLGSVQTTGYEAWEALTAAICWAEISGQRNQIAGSLWNMIIKQNAV